MMAYSHPWETEPNGVTTMADVSQDGLRAAQPELPAEPTENTVEAARARLFAKGRYIDHDKLPTPERVAAAREALNKPFRDYVDAFEAAVRADERSKAPPAVPSEAVVERIARAIHDAEGLPTLDFALNPIEAYRMVARAALAALSEEAIDA